MIMALNLHNARGCGYALNLYEIDVDECNLCKGIGLLFDFA